MSTNKYASADWVGGTRTKLLAWWLPRAALVAGLLAAVPARTAIWIAGLAWMGVACILNARRCGRTHCRFTGPYYLVIILPVLALGLGVVSVGRFGWLILGAFIILCSKAIWWATERRGGGSRSAQICESIAASFRRASAAFQTAVALASRPILPAVAGGEPSLSVRPKRS